MACLWLFLGGAPTAYMVATVPFAQLDMRAVTPIFVVGFLLQLLLGAMSYLLPQRMGGGPAVVRASNKEFSRFAAARVTAVNLALLIFMMPSSMVGQSIKIAVAIVGALALMAFIPLMVRGVKASVNTRKEMMAARARGEKPVFNPEALTPEPVPHAKQSFQAALAVAMAFLLGFAVNPSALNLPSFSSAGSVAATGQTTTVQVKATSNYRFTPAEVEVPAGNRLVVEVTNDDQGMTHDLTFDNGATTGTINPGETKTVDAGIISADQEGYCSVAGHRALGMVFKVKATGASANQVAQGGHNHGSAGTHNHAASGSTPTLMTVANSRIDMSAAPGSGYKYRDPNIPAPNTAAQVNGKTVRKVTLEVEEVDREVAPGVTVHMWTFNGQNMAPILRGKVGDIFEITLINNGTMGHSLDFHAGMVSPDNTMKTIAPGERLVYRFEAKGAGIWLYHCGTAPLSLHMTQGMYGAVIIDPADLDPVDHEYVMVQGEAYLHDTGKTASDGNKLAENSPELIAAGTPTLTMFNGHATQYKAKPLQVKKGERIRVWVMAAGPNHGTSFHVVGSQFDTVYKEGGYLMRRGAEAERCGPCGGRCSTCPRTPPPPSTRAAQCWRRWPPRCAPWAWCATARRPPVGPGGCWRASRFTARYGKTGPTRSPAARRNGSPSPGPWPSPRATSCSTSRSPGSTPPCAARPSTCSPPSRPTPTPPPALRRSPREPPVAIDVAEPLTPLTEEELAEEFVPGVIQNTENLRASEQVAFLQLSGGTTGISKLIPRTHAAYLYSVRGSVDICKLNNNTTMLVVLPAAHNFTMSSPGILGVMCASGKLVFAADPSPQTAFHLIEMEGVTTSALVLENLIGKRRLINWKPN